MDAPCRLGYKAPGGTLKVREGATLFTWVCRILINTCHDVTLVTSCSPIQIHLPAGGYVVSARTSFGRIHSDVPITSTGVIGDGALSGTIGAGGCALQLTNSNGDIRILKGGQPSR